MNDVNSLALAIAMVASFLLLAAGVKFSFDRTTRRRGILMIAAAAVLITNVMILTV